MLAILGRADASMLGALLNTAQDRVRDDLAGFSSVRQEDGFFRIDGERAASLLETLLEGNPDAFRELHATALAYLEERLREGESDFEDVFLTVFERLANHLLLEPQRLERLIASYRHAPLQTKRGRHMLQFFQGVAYRKTDQYAAALAAFDALLADPDLDDQLRGRTLNSRATCSRVLGRIEEAVNGYQASIELWRRLDNRLREGLALMNLGILYYELQNYGLAEWHLKQASACFEQTGARQWQASVENELGLLHRDQGHWSQALAYFQRFVAQRQAEGSRDEVGRGKNNIGEVLLFQGRIDEASRTLQAALADMTTDVYRVDTYLHLGLAYQAGGDLAQARTAFEKALSLADSIQRRDILPHAHFLLGGVLRLLGEDQAALEHFERAAAVIETTRRPMRDEGLKISLLGRWQQVYETLILHCLSMERVSDALLWAERARARAFSDAIMAKGRSELGAEGMSVRGEEMQRGLPARCTVLCYFTTGVLDRDVPMLQAIPADNPLREHLLTPACTLLFVITADEISAHTCPLDPNLLVWSSPRRRDPDRFLSPTVTRRLFSVLLAPAGRALDAERVYIIPHGPLHHVSFASLLDTGDRPFLRQEGPALALAPSATVLLRHCLAEHETRAPGRSCLAIGYRGEQDALYLRHTEPEALLVAELTGGEAWVGAEPKKERLREAVRGRRWLHFACHGQFDDASPLDSYLETAANERLTALEVLEGWQLQAELVVLSACQTGVSRVLRGDEPMGLVRAFISAGARSVLVTQWAVEDLPTFLLMQRFYTELQSADSTDPPLALRSAQIWLRELTADQVKLALTALQESGLAIEFPAGLQHLPPATQPFSHPRHWAPFVLVG